MAHRPKVAAFDVVQTLFSLEPLRPRLKSVGLEPDDLDLWFAHTLRDGFALTASGAYRPFQEVAAGSLRVLAASRGLPIHNSSIDEVLKGFTDLAPEPDVAPAFEMLKIQGIRIITLTNGGRNYTRGLLEKAGLDSYVDDTLSVEDVRLWKPARDVYLHAARSVGVNPDQVAMVACHAWDLHGAKQAGLTTAWVRRQEKLYQPALSVPDARGGTLVETCQELIALH